jgi:hypothetical protein
LVFICCHFLSLPGNRGLTLTIVNGTTDKNTANWASGGVSRLDDTYYETSGYSSHVSKMAGVFVAPESGSFRFYLRAKGSSSMMLTDPATSTSVVCF